MRIPAVSVKTRISDDKAAGLLLALLSALMKANKTNQVRPIIHFFRERLGRKEDRAALNVILNGLANKLAATSKGYKVRGKPVLDSAGSQTTSSEVTSIVEEQNLEIIDLQSRLRESRSVNKRLENKVSKLEDQIQASKE